MKIGSPKEVPNRLREERMKRHWRQRDVADHLGTTVVTIRRWERGKQHPHAYYLLKLCNLFGKSAEELGLSSTDASAEPDVPPETQEETCTDVAEEKTLTVWSVPYARNPYFTGRESLLAELEQRFFSRDQNSSRTIRRTALTQPQALKGLGGIGKTQIAIEYAYRVREQGSYRSILWLNASSEEAILASFATIAIEIPAFPAREESDQHKLVEAVIHWLEQCSQPWLLICDNADNVSLLQPYLPQQGNGSLLLTTRSHAVGSLATPIQVDNMDLVESTLFLLARAQRQQVSEDERDEATNVVIALDGFPLALDQAGAYIEETGCSFEEYLHLYREHRRILLARRGTQATNYPDSVATTWSLSLQKIAQVNPAAVELLRFCAFLAPDAIPEELFTVGTVPWPDVLRPALADRLRFNQAIEALLKFSLIRRRVEERALSIHRLVQVVQNDAMEAEERLQWATCAIRAVHAVFPSDPKGDVMSWPQCLRYLEQAQVCDTLIQQYQLQLPEAAELLERAGTYLSEHALYTLAEPIFQRALHLWEKQGEADHPQLLTTLNHLADLYRRLGEQEQASTLYHRALTICERHFGSDHLQIAAALSGLANVAFDQGTYAQAASLYHRALTIRERHLGPEHPQILFPLNGLADTYREMGKYAEAEPLFRRALRLREQHLGPEHPNLAHPLNNLGILYTSLGKYTEAEPLFQRALRIWEQHLGLEHPQLAYPLNGLAKLYAIQSKYAEAEPLFRRALQIREQHAGPEHPEVAHPLNNLGTLYLDQGKYAEAEPLYRRALAIWERQLGVNHAQVAYPLSNLAELFCKQGKYEQAEPLYQRALSIREQQLGPEHPHVAHACNGLATLYREQGRYANAEPFYQRALTIQERILGEHHLETAETLYDFAILQERQARYQEAASMYQRALAIREKVLGAEHTQTLVLRERLQTVQLAARQ